MDGAKKKKLGIAIVVAALVAAVAGWFGWQQAWQRDPAFEAEKQKIDEGWDELESIIGDDDEGGE